MKILQSLIRHGGLRRMFIHSAVAGMAALLLPSFATAQTWQQVEVVRQAVGEAPVSGNSLQLTLPLVAEDGSSVPLTIKAPKAQGSERIVRVELFAPANPTPQVAVFEFGPQVDEVDLSTRIRLSESQTVVAVAHTAGGAVHVTERPVRVTTSGCIAPAQSDPSSEMQARVRVPDAVKPGTPAHVLTMISHPMTTGLQQDAQGNTPPTRIIEHFEATLDGRAVLTARFFRSLAANPYLKFAVSPNEAGELRVVWTEDTGRSVEHAEALKAG